MKTLLSLIFLVFLAFNINAGEVTGAGRQVENVLAKNNLNIQKLQNMGLKVKLGEVTGAGKVHVDDIRMLVTKREVLDLSRLQHIEFNHPSSGKRSDEVKNYNFPNKIVSTNNVIAYIVE